jgi:hypothetical protein
MIRSCLATTIVLMALASPASADNKLITAEGFLKEYTTKPVAGLYLRGAYEGFATY